MRRGDIVWVDFDPARGREQKKRRPAVIVSNASATAWVDQHRDGVLTVVPLTTNTARVLSFQVLLPAASTGLSGDSKALVEQLRAVDYGRIRLRTAGRVPSELMREVDRALRLHLDL